MIFIACRDLIKSWLFVILPMSLTKSVLTKSDKKKRIQKIEKKVVKGERRSLYHNQLPYEKIIMVKGQTQIIHCKTCYYHSSIGIIHHSRGVISDRCPQCMNENLEYYSASTSRLFEYILANVN